MTAGTGHAKAAEAIAEAVRQRLPQAHVLCVDLLTYAPPWLRWAYPYIYGVLVRYLPSFWALAYYALDRRWVFQVCQPWRGRWNRLMARRFLRWVRSVQPEVVIATHFFPADVVSTARHAGWLRSRLIVVLTDLFPHRFWLVPEAEAFVVGSDETKTICQKRGIEEHRLHVLGIPVGARFCVTDGRALIASRLGLDPSRRTVLIASGGMGVGPIRELTRRFISLESTRPHQLQLLVVCGHNRQLTQQLTRVSATSAMPVRVFGFVETMHELMQASDLMVTKPGGLTIMEAMASGLAMVFCGTIPGQERLNAEYAASHGVGVIARGVKDVIDTVVRLFDEPKRLEAMKAKAIALGRPQAAQELVERLVRPITL